MRANATTRTTRECEIVDGEGMRVLPRTLPDPRTLPFSRYEGLLSRAPTRRPGPRRDDEPQQ